MTAPTDKPNEPSTARKAQAASKPDAAPKETAKLANELPDCGLIMPIAQREGYGPGHWSEVAGVIREAIQPLVRHVRIVSESVRSEAIQRVIVERIFTDRIIICDISSLNPNVLFELGMRLCSPLPTIIIKDDKTPAPFDFSFIRYLDYPHDLRYTQVVEFKHKLAQWVGAALGPDAGKHSFLETMGSITVATPTTQTAPLDEYLKLRVDEMAATLSSLTSIMRQSNFVERDVSSWSDTSRRPISRTEILDRAFAKCPSGKEIVDRCRAELSVSTDDVRLTLSEIGPILAQDWPGMKPPTYNEIGRFLIEKI